MKAEPIYRVKFSTRGRVTIPAPLRKKYVIKGGSKVAFEVLPSGAFLLRSAPVQVRT
jgi:AbrB family looped-hinge helix DNA binding protein